MAPDPECGGQRSVALPVENIRAPQDLLRPTSLPLRWTRTRTSGEGIGSDWGKELKNGHRVAKQAPWLRTARGRHRLNTLMYPEEGEEDLKAYLQDRKSKGLNTSNKCANSMPSYAGKKKK